MSAPDTHTQPWKKIANTWKNIGIGSRPSRHIIQAMERFFLRATRGKKTVQALVFGATPEIRSMLAKYPNTTVTVLDVNLEMMRAMAELMTKHPRREIWVRANWLDAPLAEHYYDVTFGDYIKGNVPYKDQPALYRQIHHLLKPGGSHIERLFSFFPDAPRYGLEAIIDRYSKMKPTFQHATDLFGYLVFLTHNDSLCTTDRMFRILHDVRSRPHMKEYDRLIRQIIVPGKTWSHGIPWSRDQRTVIRYFTLSDRADDDTVFHKWSHVFYMKPRRI